MSGEFSGRTIGRRLLAFGQTTVTALRGALRADDLLRHGGLMSAATVLIGGLNYLYQVFVGRALGPEQYGVFGAAFALLYLVNVLGTGVRFSSSRFVAELDGERGALGTNGSVGAFVTGLQLRATAFGAVVFGGLALASGPVASFVGLGDPTLVVLVALNGFGVLVLRANLGALQGLQRFGALAGYRLSLAVLKLAAAVALVAAGYAAAGALGAVVLAVLALLVVTTAWIHAQFEGGLRAVPDRLRGHDFDYRRAYRYAPAATLAGFCLTVPATADVIVVKHFFTDHQAGLYTAASVLGKVLVFLPTGITSALFPKVSHDRADDQRLHGLLDRALAYSAAVAGAGALAYWVAPRFLLALVFGPAYVEAAPLLRWYGLAIVAAVLAIVVLNFQLARDRNRFVYVFTAASCVEILLLWRFHASMIQVVQVMVVTNALLFAYGYVAVKLKQ
ncbi:lipopolysaccharide biosynthesis protein [Halorussus halophilus]|uniref:lipopolysaccharide biosynthesis protein n=1 Tax=Halorussus halophilus TaxID=2650975 RepID=UPI001300E6E7|nr:oligosaccharide flippase family protein [Halorussus halophilus]